ncbi:MAG: GNAT family N-acetyltransferase [Coriobacteriia bacterium]|nr:GNAT family N-acetyltransferase [Coriobacteriia bacterium]
MARLVWVAPHDARMRAVCDLRHEVLMAPFGVPRDDDWGDDDPASSHLLALEGERVVGYVRLIVRGEEAQLRHVAVAFDRQRSGVGTALVEEACRRAAELGAGVVHLNARLPAVGFYQRLGFIVTSDEPFSTGRTGLPHVRMERRFEAAR